MGLITWGLSIAPWLLFGVDGVLDPGTFDTTTAINIYSLIVSLVGGIFGGWIAATIGRSRVTVLVLLGLGLLASIGNVFVHISKAEPGPRTASVSVIEAVSTRKEPLWYTLVIPVLGAAGILIGGRMTFRKSDGSAK
jgi:hypothetical protein